MRRTFVNWLLENDDKDTYFITAGVGFGVLEPLQKKMKGRFINVGIAEPSMIGIASGIALNQKKVYTYTMCCFYLRCVEQIKLDLCYQDVPVTMIGVGTQFDYEQHGTTHFAMEDEEVMLSLNNLDVLSPVDKNELLQTLKNEPSKPRYIRISRFDESKDAPLSPLEQYPKEAGSLGYLQKKYCYLN